MANTDLAVRIATILDASGLKKADKGFKGLESSAKSLGKTIGVALSAAAIVSFGKKAVNAFAEDEAAATRLNNAVKNLGLGFEQSNITAFISDLEKTSGVLDDYLRPAFQALLTTTGSNIKSQELLNLAIDVSRGSGIDLTTVVQDLANAYVGNTKGLKKYNLGLSQTQLKSMKFLDVQERLNEQFQGSSAAYLQTYAGKMDVLKVASANAAEAIGGSLVDAIMTLTSSTSAEGLGQFIDKITGYLTGLIDSVSFFIFSIQWLMKPKNWLRHGKNKDGLNPMEADWQALKNPATGASTIDNYNMTTAGKAAAAARKKAEQEAARRAKELLKAQEKNTKELQKQAATKKQSALFDIEKIGIVAALQGKISEEEKLRLNLQMALLTGNDKLAADLAGKLADSIDSTGKLKTWLATLPDANNPFKGWDTWLTGFTDRLKATLALTATGGSLGRGESFPSLSPTVQDLVSGAVTGRAGATAAGDVYVTVQGSVLSEQDLVAAVQNGLQLNSLSGKPSDIGRIAGMFG
jgi:ribosomal protein L12E/L44/L45/RPP1/RPP2